MMSKWPPHPSCLSRSTSMADISIRRPRGIILERVESVDSADSGGGAARASAAPGSPGSMGVMPESPPIWTQPHRIGSHAPTSTQ